MIGSLSIGLDLGTGAVKGILWDGKRILAQDAFEVTFLRTETRVEIAPLPYREEVFSLLRRLAAKAPSKVDSIAMCAASGNTLVTDGNGSPLSNIISWLDPRKCEPPDSLVHEIIGWPWVGGFSYTHLVELRRNDPHLFAPDSFFGMNNDWLQFLLSGVRFLDYSSATPFYLQDQRNFHYHQPYLEKLGISQDQLPRLVASGCIMGTLRPELAEGNLTPETRIVSGSFDHPAAARACGILHPGDILLSCGTSWVGFTPAEERRIRPGVLIDPFLAPEGSWGEIVSLTGIGRELEEQIVRSYSSGPDRYLKFNEDALSSGPSAGLMRSTVAKFRSLLDKMEHFGKVILTGGLAESPAWKQMITDGLGCPVESSPFGKYAGAVGAAMLAMNADNSQPPEETI